MAASEKRIGHSRTIRTLREKLKLIAEIRENDSIRDEILKSDKSGLQRMPPPFVDR